MKEQFHAIQSKARLWIAIGGKGTLIISESTATAVQFLLRVRT